MKTFALTMLLLIPIALGCGASVESAGTMEKIQGKALAADGSPLSNVRVVLQPIEKGYVTELETDAKGTFAGEAISGKYVYYFAPSKKTKSALPKAVSNEWVEPKKEHLVDVKPNSEIVCQIQ